MRTILFTTTILAPAAALAGGYAIPTESPRDLALSQSAVAAQTGADAILLNVSALAGQEGLDASLAGALLNNRTDWSAPDLGSASLVPQNSMPPTASVGYGGRLDNGMGWGAGIGFGVIGVGTIKWPNGWAGQEQIQSVTQRVYQMAAGVAFQPLPYLKVGADYIRYHETLELHQALNYLDHYGDAGLAVSGGGNSFGVAAEFRVPTIPLTIGATYRRSATLSMSGDAHFTAVPPADQVQLHDQGVTEHVTFPDFADLGAAYEVMPDLKVMASVSLERWSVYDKDTFVGADGFMASVPRNYKNAFIYRIGGEWQHVPFLPGLTLRVGGLRSVSDQPHDTVSPSLTDGNSTAGSVGAGYDVVPGVRIDLGYQHVFFDKVTAATGPDTFPGTYKTQVDLVALGINWRTDLKFLSGR